jgi:hypothetical protein
MTFTYPLFFLLVPTLPTASPTAPTYTQQPPPHGVGTYPLAVSLVPRIPSSSTATRSPAPVCIGALCGVPPLSTYDVLHEYKSAR